MQGTDPNLPSRYGASGGQALEIKPGLITLDFQQATYDEMATTLYGGGPLFMRTLNDLQLTSRGLEQAAGYRLVSDTALASTIRNISDFDNSSTPPAYTPRPIVLTLNATLGQLNVYDYDGGAFILRGNIAPGVSYVAGDGSFVQYGLDSYFAPNTAGSLAIQKKAYGANYADAPGTAPKASSIVQFGSRLIAIAADGDFDKVQWPDNGNYDLWTGTSSGSVLVLPEGYFNDQNPLVAGALVEQGTMLFRRNTITLMSVTGQSTAPFRFATTIPGLGLAGKQAIVRTSLCSGLFFVTNGYSVVYYNNGELTDIGYPIRDTLIRHCSSSVTLAIDEVNADLWLMTQSHTTVLYKFNLTEFLARKRVLWSRVDTSSLTTAGGGEFVDAISSVFQVVVASSEVLTETGDTLQTETASDLMTDIPFATTLKSVWLGCNNFKIVGTDYSSITTAATSETVDIRIAGEEVTVAKFRMIGYNYGGYTPSPVSVRFSMDAGATWSAVQTFTPVSTLGFQMFTGSLNITGRFIRVEFSMPTGVTQRTFAVQRMELLVNDRGRGTN